MAFGLMQAGPTLERGSGSGADTQTPDSVDEPLLNAKLLQGLKCLLVPEVARLFQPKSTWLSPLRSAFSSSLAVSAITEKSHNRSHANPPLTQEMSGCSAREHPSLLAKRTSEPLLSSWTRSKLCLQATYQRSPADATKIDTVRGVAPMLLRRRKSHQVGSKSRRTADVPWFQAGWQLRNKEEVEMLKRLSRKSGLDL